MQEKSKSFFWVNPQPERMCLMGKDNRNEIRRALDRAERGITRSVIRWKYKKEGRPLPPDDDLEGQSIQVVDQAHKIMARRGRSVWNELRNVYARQKEKKEGDNG